MTRNHLKTFIWMTPLMTGVVLAAPAKKAAKAAKSKPAAAAAKPAPPPGPAPLTFGRLSLSGLIDARFIVTDTARVGTTLPTTGLKTRYTGTGDTTGTGAAVAAPQGNRRSLFKVSQASLQGDLLIEPGWTFKTRLNLLAEDTPTLAGRMGQTFAGGGSVGVIYAFVHGKAAVGKKADLKLGAFSLPFFHESMGKIGTGKLTISSGTVSAMVKGNRVQGVEVSLPAQGAHTVGNLALSVFNNGDAIGALAPRPNAAGATNLFRLQDLQGDIQATGDDTDGKMGFYLDGQLMDKAGRWQADLGYFSNGANGSAGTTDTAYWIASGRVNLNQDWLVQAHAIGGQSDAVVGAAKNSADWRAWSLLVSALWGRTRATVRWDDYINKIDGLAGRPEDGTAWSLGLRYDVTPNRVLQAEYIHPDNAPRTAVGPTRDARDDQFQLSYQFFF